MDSLIDAFGKAFKTIIHALYELDQYSTIDALKSMSLDVNVRVLEKSDFAILVAATIAIGMILACIFGCFMCCCSCCCCPVYQDDYHSSLSSNSTSSLTNRQDTKYNYYG